MRLGIVGFGNVGQDVAARLTAGAIGGVELHAVAHTSSAVAEERVAKFSPTPKVLTLDQLAEECDLVIESATASAMPGIARAVLKAGKTLISISVAGALAIPDLDELTRAHGGRVIFPSGALPGLDLIRSAREGSILEVSITSRLRIESLETEPFITGSSIDLRPPQGGAVKVFTGNARDAALAFPRHFNVAVTLALAGAGLERTRVEIWADPSVKGSCHRVSLRSEDVGLELESTGIPSSANGRTSRIVAPSVMAAIRNIAEPIQIGS